MTAREILAYAITHAPRGVKGGPYESWRWRLGTATESLEEAARCASREEADPILESVRKVVPTARVIRIVRKARPSEASAVEVLRELVASLSSHEGLNLSDLADRARAVLAASGPDPMPVVRAALSWSEATAANGTARTVALQLACVAYRKAGGK